MYDLSMQTFPQTPKATLRETTAERSSPSSVQSRQDAENYFKKVLEKTSAKVSNSDERPVRKEDETKNNETNESLGGMPNLTPLSTQEIPTVAMLSVATVPPEVTDQGQPQQVSRITEAMNVAPILMEQSLKTDSPLSKPVEMSEITAGQMPSESAVNTSRQSAVETPETLKQATAPEPTITTAKRNTTPTSEQAETLFPSKQNLEATEILSQRPLSENGENDEILTLHQQDTSKIFVKVGEKSVDVNPKQLVWQLSEKIVVQSANGNHQFDIELNPRELGNIHIKLLFEGNRATVLLQCSNPQTQQLINAHADQIKSIVETGSGMQTEISVKENAENAFDQPTAEHHGENQAREEQNQRLRELEQRKIQSEMSSFIAQFRLEVTNAS